MLRYYLIASVLVLGGLLIGTLFAHRAPPLRVASVAATGTPSPPRAESASTLQPGGVSGVAPWALSALPECFRQEREARGPFAYVRAQLPPGGRQLGAGAVLRAADCTLRVESSWLSVERGSERLVIPAPARAFLSGQVLALLRRSGRNGELRVYRPAAGRWSLVAAR